MLKIWGVVLAFLAAVTSGAQTGLANSDAVRSSVLPHGITVLTSERPVGQVVAFHAAFRGGSRDEDDSTVGAAHFMEHMFFQGASRYAAWKIQRHTGVEVEVTPFRERHPILSAPAVLLKVSKNRRRAD